jgi:hypothetical protein
VRYKANPETGFRGDYLLDTERRFLWHCSVHTKRIKKIAQQVLMAIFLAILLVAFLAHRLFHPR